MPNIVRNILYYEEFNCFVKLKNNKNNKTFFIFENFTKELNDLLLYKDIPIISTDETRQDDTYDVDDDEYQQTRILIPKFQVSWNYADNTNPDIEYFDNIEDAIKDLHKMGDTNDLDKYYEPNKELSLVLKDMWVDRNNEEIEGNGMMNYEDWSYKNKESNFVKKYGLNSWLYTKYFNSREKTADELLTQVYLDIHNDLIKIYNYNDVNFTIDTQSRGKYRNITVYYTDSHENDLEKTIILRIADHSYNPRNNDGMTDFISVEIANKNETAGRFHGIHGLQFDGDNTYEDVVNTLNLKIIDIIESWNIKK